MRCMIVGEWNKGGHFFEGRQFYCQCFVSNQSHTEYLKPFFFFSYISSSSFSHPNTFIDYKCNKLYPIVITDKTVTLLLIKPVDYQYCWNLFHAIYLCILIWVQIHSLTCSSQRLSPQYGCCQYGNCRHA